MAGAERVFGLLDTDAPGRAAAEAAQPAAIRAWPSSFDHVDFAYKPGVAVLAAA